MIYFLNKLNNILIMVISLIIFVISCSSIKNNRNEIINTFLNKKLQEKNDPIYLFIGENKTTNLFKILSSDQPKKLKSFLDFLEHHNIPIDIINERSYFINQLSGSLEINLDDIIVDNKKISLLNKYDAEKKIRH